MLAVTTDFPLLERGEDGLAGRLDRAHQLDDDVDVVARNQRFDVVGEQLDRHAAVVGHTADPDAAQHQRRADAGGQVDALSSMMRTTSLPTLPRPNTATPMGFSSPFTTNLQADQIVDSLPAQDQPRLAVPHGDDRGTAERL